MQKSGFPFLRTCCLLLCLVVYARASPAQSPTDRLQRANEAYGSEDYDTAIADYEQLLTQGYRSEALLYNLGNAYYRREEMGKAVLNYERALLLDPGDADARHNLEVIRRRFPEELEAVPGFFLPRWWRGLHQSAGADLWGILGVVLIWLGVGSLAVWLLAPQRNIRKRGFFAGMILLLLAILPFALASAQRAYEARTGFAVILSGETTLRSGADRQSTEVTTLPAGIKVELLDQIGDWHKVRLENREQGWLPDGAFEPIDLTF